MLQSRRNQNTTDQKEYEKIMMNSNMSNLDNQNYLANLNASDEH